VRVLVRSTNKDTCVVHLFLFTSAKLRCRFLVCVRFFFLSFFFSVNSIENKTRVVFIVADAETFCLINSGESDKAFYFNSHKTGNEAIFAIILLLPFDTMRSKVNATFL
jgi:hypothetical protein